MKMETVIRSPQSGVVKRLAHKEGVSLCSPLTVLSVFHFHLDNICDISSLGNVQLTDHVNVS